LCAPPAERRLLLFSALLLLLALKGDGHFPFPTEQPESTFQLYVLGLTIAFGLGLGALLADRSATSGAAGGPAPLRLAAGVGAFFVLLDGGLLWLEARRYAEFGYGFHAAAVVAGCVIAAGSLAWLARRRAPEGAAILAVAMAAQAGVCLYACAYFPLASARSDMLPLLAAAGHRLVAGHDPYVLYQLTAGGGVDLTYLPGLVLAYLPAAALHLDPRLLGLAYTGVASWIVWRRAGDHGAAFLAVFLMNPYLVYRHDIYLAPFWLLLALCWAALARPRPAILAACCAALGVTSQLLLVPAAALAIFGIRRFGAWAMVRWLVPAAAPAALLCALFVLPDPAGFARGTLGHWSAALNVESLGFTYWLLPRWPPLLVHALQALLVGTLLILPRGVWRAGIDGRRPGTAFAAAAAALACFAALNTVIWTYFYLLVLFLAMLAQLDGEPAPMAVPVTAPAP
jgi:hypothetical protein